MSTGSTPPGGTPGSPQPGAPGSGAPQPGGAGPADGTRFSVGAVIGIAVAVLAIAGVGGYLIGHNAGESSGDSAGYAQGLADGKRQVEANFKAGQPGYERIFAAGRAEGVAAGKKAGEKQGERVGFEQGERQGISTGQSEGVRQGASAVLGGFDSWTDGAYYIITMSSGNAVPYAISSRTQIEPGTSYQLCSDGGGQHLCEAPVSSGGDAGGGSGDSGDGGGDDDTGGAQD